MAIKNVSYNEPYFQGHFPHEPIMPGVLILEALAQTTGLLAGNLAPDVLGKGKTYYLVGLDKARFKRPVEPGDQLQLEARIERRIRRIYKFSATARVGNELVSSAEFMTTEMEEPA